MRPVYLSHSGLWGAAGSSPGAIRQALFGGAIAPDRLDLFGESFPYAFATAPDKPCQARLEEALAAVGASLELASLGPDTPVLIGSSSLLIGALEEGPWPPPAQALEPVAGLRQTIQANWGLGEKGWVFSSACASAVHALDAAIGLIGSGAVEEAVVLGVEILNRATPLGFSALQLLSPSGARPLDADRDGLVLGEAVAAVRLRARPTPWRAHAPALSLDATSATGFAPDGSSIAAVMRAALDNAGLGPNDIRAIKLQASGALGTDAVEARALAQVFLSQPALFSLKGALGHTLGACGLAEMVAVLQCLEAGWLPPTAGFARPDPELGLSPLQAPRAWSPGACLFNIQGFGGCLASWVVEQL